MLILPLSAITMSCMLAHAVGRVRNVTPVPVEWRDVEVSKPSFVNRVSAGDYRPEELEAKAAAIRHIVRVGAGTSEAALANGPRMLRFAELHDDLAHRERIARRIHEEIERQARDRRTVRAVYQVQGVVA